MAPNIITIENVGVVYKSNYNDSNAKIALSDINITIQKGQFVAIIGRNGSGKSTLARLLNALLLPTNGFVYINGLNTRDENHLWDIRRSAGMVFQNPDNQIIGTTVEEDVAFGPENLGIPPDEIVKRVYDMIEVVGMSEYIKHAPHLLSGGQKQRVAIAGILAMKPECIILDEATAMLDPVGRQEVMQVIKKLNKEEGITIIHITHHMDEVGEADRVIIIDDGKIMMDGSPKQVFSDVEKVKKYGMDVPQVTELIHELNKHGFDFPSGVLSVDEAFDVLAKKIRSAF